jgi:hypothetical protein
MPSAVKVATRQVGLFDPEDRGRNLPPTTMFASREWAGSRTTAVASRGPRLKWSMTAHGERLHSPLKNEVVFPAGILHRRRSSTHRRRR